MAVIVLAPPPPSAMILKIMAQTCPQSFGCLCNSWKLKVLKCSSVFCVRNTDIVVNIQHARVQLHYVLSCDTMAVLKRRWKIS